MASVLSTPPETPPALGFMRPLLSWPKPVAALGWGGCGCGCGAGAGVGCTLAEAACALRTSALFFAAFNAAAACVFSAGDKAASWALVSASAMAACNAALALLMAWLAAAASVAEILPSLSVSWLRVKAACTAWALVAISAMAVSATTLEALGFCGAGGCGAGAGVGCTLAEAACALRTFALFFALFNAEAACVFSAGDKAASWALVSALAMAACNAALALLMAWLAAAASVAEILPSLSVSWLRVKAACTAWALVAISAMALSAAVLAALGVDGTVGRDWVLGCPPPPPPPQAVSARLHAMAKAFKVKFPVFIVFSCGWLFGGKSVSNQWVQAAFYDDGITLRAFRPAAKSSLHVGGSSAGCFGRGIRKAACMRHYHLASRFSI